MKCIIAVTPIKGKPTVKEITLRGDTATVQQALEKAGIKAGKEFSIHVGGHSANLSTTVSNNENVALTEKVAGS
jgi:hypothetical protein